MGHQEVNGVEFEQGRRLNRYLELLLKLRSDFYGLQGIDTKFLERDVSMHLAGKDVTPLTDVVDKPVFEHPGTDGSRGILFHDTFSSDGN